MSGVAVAIVTGAFALGATALTVFGSIKSASRQREPQMITASQHVLTTTIEALTNEVNRKNEAMKGLEVENLNLRRQLRQCRANCG